MGSDKYENCLISKFMHCVFRQTLNVSSIVNFIKILNLMLVIIPKTDFLGLKIDRRPEGYIIR